MVILKAPNKTLVEVFLEKEEMNECHSSYIYSLKLEVWKLVLK